MNTKIINSKSGEIHKLNAQIPLEYFETKSLYTKENHTFFCKWT